MRTKIRETNGAARGNGLMAFDRPRHNRWLVLQVHISSNILNTGPSTLIATRDPGMGGNLRINVECA
jgi:hypothetical protein